MVAFLLASGKREQLAFKLTSRPAITLQMWIEDRELCERKSTVFLMGRQVTRASVHPGFSGPPIPWGPRGAVQRGVSLS